VYDTFSFFLCNVSPLILQVKFVSYLNYSRSLIIGIFVVMILDRAYGDRRFREAEIPFPRIWHRAGSKGSEAPAGPVRVLNRGRKKARGGLESWPRGGFRRARDPLFLFLTVEYSVSR